MKIPKVTQQQLDTLPRWEELEEKLLADPEVKAAYDALESEFQLISELIGKRLEKNLTQKQLAEKIGTKQSAICRLESGEGNPSFKFLKRVAKGLDSKLQISFV
ncbi:helix-turn-helix transcriptional regulator [Candidatus Woesebacteria bacterium]|nr:helix-turn-helix transcriptional regulator [Candidatus Woesebacteria bacterium]